MTSSLFAVSHWANDATLIRRDVPAGIVPLCVPSFFLCRGVLLISTIVGQGPFALAEGTGGAYLDFFLSSVFSLFILPFWETARCRLKYCLKGPFNPKQPTIVIYDKDKDTRAQEYNQFQGGNFAS